MEGALCRKDVVNVTGRYDMKPFFRQHGQQPWSWRLQVGKNYGFNSGGK